jgi:hypothetical protein
VRLIDVFLKHFVFSTLSAQFGHLRVLIIVFKEIAVPFCHARSSLLFLVCACSLLLSCLLARTKDGKEKWK